MLDKEILGGIAVVLCLLNYGVYGFAIYQGKIKPHLFTWLIFCLMTSIGFAAQYSDGAGAGAWNLLFVSIANGLIALASFWRGEKKVAKSDWACLIVALLAIPIWRLTDNALNAVLIITAINALAIVPTFRKSWLKPHEESASAFSIGAVQFSLSIFALNSLTITSALFPISIVIENIALVLMLLYRRRVLQRT